MARLEIIRHDYPLRIQSDGAGKVFISREDIDVVLRRDVGPLSDEELGYLLAELAYGSPPSPRVSVLTRLTLRIDEIELHAYPWESWIDQRGKRPFHSIVRVSEVPARVAHVTFSAPLRVLLCDSPDAAYLLSSIRDLFGGYGNAEKERAIAKAFRSGALSIDEVEGPSSVPFGWPVVDILHLFKLPAHEEGRQLSPFAGDRGSLGWLSQLLQAWQVRLLVINSDNARSLDVARTLAAAIVARGGPAVVVFGDARSTSFFTFERVYEQLVHDFPVDVIALRSEADCCFVGGGREEIVRVSSSATALQRLQDGPDQSLSDRYIWDFDEFGTSEERRLMREISLDGSILSLDRLTRDYRRWEFSHREADGMVPLAGALHELRRTAVHALARSLERTDGFEPRYVNASLWRRRRDEQYGRERVDAWTERVHVGKTHEVILQVGERDVLVPVYATSPFQEIPRIPGQEGVWVEVAVNGVGFKVLGDAVQDLFIPFDKPSDLISFAVVPERQGVAILRYTIYYQQNVVQSYRLAALTGESESYEHQEADRLQLAEALHADVEHVPARATYVTRLEYEATEIARAGELPERQISIVANDAAGQRVIAVKGRRFFFDSSPAAAGPLLQAARDALFEASIHKADLDRRDWTARFGINLAVNAKNFREQIPQLALAGWRMYSRIFPRDIHPSMKEELATADSKIAVAHALLEEVIPWALMYDMTCNPPSVPRQ